MRTILPSTKITAGSHGAFTIALAGGLRQTFILRSSDQSSSVNSVADDDFEGCP